MRKANRRARIAQDERRHGRLAAEPTHHYPGSIAKLDVMAERLLRNESLFHPLDVRARRDEDTTPTRTQRLVYSGSSRISEVKEKVPGKTHEWVQKKVTAYVLNDKQWRRMLPLVPVRNGLDKRQKAVALAQHRNAINGMLYVLFRDIPWPKIPERYCYFGVVKKDRHKSVSRVWHNWKATGKWLDLLRAARLVGIDDRIQWHRLERVTVQA